MPRMACWNQKYIQKRIWEMRQSEQIIRWNDDYSDVWRRSVRAVVDLGSICVYCNEDTEFGSGRLVNRLGADTYDEEKKEYRYGYACAECMATEWDRCDKTITLDEDVTSYDVYGDDAQGQFSDGACRVNQEWLTAQEEQYQTLLEEDYVTK